MFSSRVALIVPVGLGDTTKSDDFLTKKNRKGKVIFNTKIYIADFSSLYSFFGWFPKKINIIF